MSSSGKFTPFEVELRSMPKSNRLAQYFPWDTTMQDYNIDSFDPTLADNKVSSETLVKVLESLRKSDFFAAEYIPVQCWLIPVSIALLILGVSLVGQNNSEPGVLQRVLTIILTVLMILLPVGLLMAARRKVSWREQVRVSKLKGLIKDLQTKYFPDNGVDLRISSLGSYLILDTSRNQMTHSTSRGGMF